MRVFLAILMLLPAAQGALLEDAAGDVAIQHCEAAQSPATGFDAMDLLRLDVEETPDHISFNVTAAGLEDEAGPDAGNYFVYLRRGEQHYALRMYQDNAGTGAIAQLVATEGVTFFGPTIAELPADIQEGIIRAAVPRHLLLDHDGAVPVRGQSLEGIMASAEAHATGIYACSFDGGGGGPAIVQDRMPDGLAEAQAGRITFQFGGGSATGPIRLDVERPFRASNGDATTYAFQATLHNEGEGVQRYDVGAERLPEGWRLTGPGPLAVEPGQQVAFTSYLAVPFQHRHGTTTDVDLVVRAADGSAEAVAQVGVHYVAVPQPAGHHATVHLHSVAALGPFTAFSEAAGGGGHHMYWNTLEEDPMDQGVPVANQLVEGDLAWYGCLGPRLAMGLAPGLNETGSFDLSFESDFDLAGELQGAIRLVEEERGAACHQARDWEPGEHLMALDPQPIALSGAGAASGAIELAFDRPIPYRPGTDLLLEIRIVPDASVPVGGTVDLLGGRLKLPLADHHEDAPTAAEQTPASKDGPARERTTPAAVWPAALLAVAWLRRR